MGSVLQDWVQELPMMQQTVLLTAVRGPDGVGKYHSSKFVLRWLRRCILLSAMDAKVLTNPYDRNGGSFTGPSIDWAHRGDWRLEMTKVFDEYLRSLDELPHHFQMHLMHAVQIIGYKHPDDTIRNWWLQCYDRLVNDMHLHPETKKEMDWRLGDNREQWLERNDPATVN